jgi:hypothetical protein
MALPRRLFFLVLALIAADARAAFHLWEVTEVYTNAGGNVQYFELSTTSNSQHVLDDHVFRAVSDGVERTYTLPNNLGSSLTANTTFLIATPGFQQATGVVPDFTLPCGPFFNPDAASIKIELVGADSVTFNGSSLPSSSTQALHFSVAGSLSTNVASPKNFAGATTSMTAACLDDGDCPNNCQNTPPNIVAGPQMSLCQGASVEVEIAEVSDAEDFPGSLLVDAASMISGLTVSDIVNDNGTVTATLTASSSAATGSGTVSMLVTDSGMLTDSANLFITVTPNAAPTLGNYPDTSVVAGTSKTVTPSAPPSDDSAVDSVTATITAGFAGTVSVDPGTGVVTITNAGGASSTYTVTITATDDCGAETVKTFTLTRLSLQPPTNLTAVLTAPLTASLTWTAADGATNYTVQRRTLGTDWVTIGSGSATFLNDPTLVADRGYLYRVQSSNGGATAGFSVPDYVTTFGYTDNPIAAGTTPVKAQHALELREAVDGLYAAMAMTPPSWGALAAGNTVQVGDVTTLRTAIATLRSSLSMPAFSFTGTLTAGTTAIAESHFAELRVAAKGYCPTANCS